MIARSVHAPLAEVIAGGAPARVISAHGWALNLALADGQLLSLVAPELGNGPGTVVMAADWPLPWRPGEVVRIDPAWAGAPHWAPPEPPRAQSPAPAVAAEAIARAGGRSSLLPAPGSALADLAAPGLGLLAAGRWGAAVPHLTGLGPGLTPAGDDLLCGCCVALHRAGAPGALSLGAALRRVPDSATTPLSRHLLRWAAEGVAGEHLLAWLDSVLAGSPIDPGRVLAHGATSGADWAAGALLALRVIYPRSAGVSTSTNQLTSG